MGAMEIIGAIAAVITWLAARQVDQIVGKWVAYVTIAWQNSASEKAQKAYRETVIEIQKDVVKNYGTWEEWRKKVGV